MEVGTQLSQASGTLLHEREKKRLQWIDLVKGITIILVIYGHAMTPTELLRQVIYSFHMPLFFVLAGYTFSSQKSLKATLSSSAYRILVPLLVVFILSEFISVQHGASFSRTRSFLKLVWGNGNWPFEHPALGITLKTVGAMWFFWCLFWSRIIFWLILRGSCMQRVRLYGLTALVAVAGYCLSRHFPLPMNIDIACVCSVYMLAGYEIKRAKADSLYISLPKVSRAIVLLLLTALWLSIALEYKNSIGARYYGVHILGFIGAIAGSLLLFLLCKEMEKRNKTYRWLTYAGVYSLSFLCFHILERKVWPNRLFASFLNTLGDMPDYVVEMLVGTKGVILCFLLTFCWIFIKSRACRIYRSMLCKWVAPE